MIRSLRKQNITLKLTRSFRGIELDQNVNIAEIDQDSASFRVIGKKIYSGVEEYVHIQSGLFPKVMVAHVKSSEINQGIIILSQFAYIETDWKERKEARVRPKTPMYVDLHWREKSLSACLVDFSAAGMGVMAHEVLESGIDIQPGSAIKLDFHFSPNDIFTSMKGTIVYSHALNRSFLKLGIRLIPNAAESLSMEKLFTDRKQETMLELDQKYRESNTQRRVENMYF
jgi:hypothetical protein